MKPTDEPVIVTQLFGCSAGRLWSAITQLEQMQQWYFPQLTEFAAKVGFATSFVVEHEGKTFPHVWKITEVVEEKKLVCDWSYSNWPGRGLVTWELLTENDGLRLRLTNKVIEEFPDDEPAFRRESCEAGWRYFIKKQLPSYIASHTTDEPSDG